MGARVGRAAAALGLAASAGAHLLSFTPLGARVPDSFIVVIFAGAIVLLLVMLARLRRRVAPARAGRRVEVLDWRGLSRRVPAPLSGLVVTVAAYSLLNFALAVLTEAGALRIATGHGLLFYLIPFTYFAHVEPTLS
ncbi:MAG TPA: hypothetical protein VFX14_05715 [Methylomirabilota bacterium]|nr:hypothetical protein [Methylomirabilota bacterium]